MNFNSPAPMRRIAYHARSATYGVLASMPKPTTSGERMELILQSLEKHDKRNNQSLQQQAEQEAGEVQKRVPHLFEEPHEFRVYRSDSREMIKSLKLKQGEVGLAIENMAMNVFKQRMAAPGVNIPSSHQGED